MSYVPPHLRRQLGISSTAAKPVHPAAGRAAAAAAAKPDHAKQQEAWQRLHRGITSCVNKVTMANLGEVIVALLRNNIIRGRGLFAKAMLQIQLADPDMSAIFAAFVAVVNKEFPDVGLLLVQRLIVMWKRYHRRRDIFNLKLTGRFLAHLAIQRVIDYMLIMKLLSMFLCASEIPSDDDIECATALLGNCYAYLDSVDPKAFAMLLEPLRGMILEDNVGKRSESYIEALLDEIREWGTKKHQTPIIPEELDVVLPEEQKTHDVDLEALGNDLQMKLDRFEYDADYDAAEATYENIARSILGDAFDAPPPEESEGDGEDEEVEGESGDARTAAVRKRLRRGEDGSDDDEDSGDDANVIKAGEGSLLGSMATTGANSSGEADPFAYFGDQNSEELRKSIYLAIRSSIRHEEVAHKLLRNFSNDKNDGVIVKMLLETCCQETMYKRPYSMTAESLCRTKSSFQKLFIELFRVSYRTADDSPLAKIKMLCEFYAYLFAHDAFPWDGLDVVDVKDAFSSLEVGAGRRHFIQEFLRALVKHMTMKKLKQRFREDVELRPKLVNLFPNGTELELKFAHDVYAALELGELMEGRTVAVQDEPEPELSSAPHKSKPRMEV